MRGTLPRRPARPRGMTLVEVIVALVLMAGVLLAMGRFSGALAHTTGTARVTATATQLVADRLEQVKSAPRYTAIESLYVATENSIGGFTGYTRQTTVKRVGGTATDSIDYKIVTVQVSNGALPKPVRKSTVIAPF
jgi:prepilin-type N-terminal cleavage/methylation domain-containing protein